MQYGLSWGEAIKREINREFGKTFSDISGKPVDFEHPQMIVIWNIAEDDVDVFPSPLFVYGRYRKIIRGIPQTRWPCRICQGKGCDECKGTGKRYQTSVEEQIRDPFIQTFQALDGKFHGAGREDIDARMLGTGRPFVFELINPRIRNSNLEELEKKINTHAKGKVEVQYLKYSTMDIMRRLKAFASHSSKTYKALIRFEQPIQDSQLVQLDHALTGAIIQQQTPIRVKHRRADRVRKKQIYTCKSTIVDETHFITEIHCQGGLYIKELVTGDEERTQPNMTQLLGIPAVVQELDVIQVNTEDPSNG
jgi:tRNA pseudouridine synthase 10